MGLPKKMTESPSNSPVRDGAGASVDAITYEGSYLETRWEATGRGTYKAVLHNARTSTIAARELGAGRDSLVVSVDEVLGGHIEVPEEAQEACVLQVRDRDAGNDGGEVREAIDAIRRSFVGSIHVVCHASSAPDGITSRPTAIPSVFDVPYDPGDRTPKNRMEESLRRALESSRLLIEEGLVVGKRRFGEILVGSPDDGRTVASICEERVPGLWGHPSYGEFDLVVYHRDTREVVVAIEVDGSVHRYAYHTTDEERNGRKERWRTFSLPTTTEEAKADRDALALRSSYDCKKDWFVRECLGGTCARLVPIADEMPVRLVRGVQRKRFGKSDWLAAHELEWVLRPCDVPDGSPFVYLRIPTDGGTFLEVEALVPKAHAGERPPTIEDFVRRQLECAASAGTRLYAGDVTTTGHVGKNATSA